MAFGNVIDLFENKAILVIGATGFLGKVFVEKILRIQPNVKKIYLLVRAGDFESATQRLHDDIVGKELFRVIRETWGASLYSFISEKLIAVPGNVFDECLGVTDYNLREEMQRAIDIAVNFAATTNFDERYDSALATNTFGALNALLFAKKCLNIKLFVHVSTAYVCGEDAGLILENPLQIGQAKRGTRKIDIDKENNLVKEKLQKLQSKVSADQEAITIYIKDLGTKRARLYGWPNTYAFTKAMGEMLLMTYKDDLPLLILRPTIITSTYKEPFPGWTEGRPRTMDSLILAAGLGRLPFFPWEPQSILDLIPADIVVNAIIVAMVARANQYSEKFIYNVGSSARNPITVGDVSHYTFLYFTKKPWINKDGKSVRMRKIKTCPTMSCFKIHIAIRYLLPVKALKFATTMSCQKDQSKYDVLHRNIRRLMRLANLYKPYVFFSGNFDDTNLEELRMATKEAGLGTSHCFEIDPVDINWGDYIMNVHIPALVDLVTKYRE